LYNKTCSMGSTALWSAQSIFENHAFWFDVDRGLFIYTNNQSGEDFYFPRAIKEYCEDTINWINGKSPCEVYG
ncbi:hypothetical protein HYV50_00010, partial [Candidatus Pacearchaeota archaeon]|nr:hypothetical protein [Candidatus Pacearchaeota archaeon]